MNSYPVRFTAVRPEQYTRVQLIVRLIAFMVLGLFGLSLGTVFFAAFIGLPAYAAARLAGTGGAEAYLERDGERLARALRWYAAITSWFGLVTERVPSSPEQTVTVDIEPSGNPTPGSALARLIFGIPSALVLGLLGFIAWFVWLWAAISVLLNERVGEHTHAFLTGMQRWAVRLLAYQASLVEPYPPFSFEAADPGAHGGIPRATATHSAG